jgi:hypothetical protein
MIHKITYSCFTGIIKKMNPMRIKSPAIPLKKVMSVRPSPLRTLCRVVFKYKKGQIQERMVIKSPASSFEKI